jgi:hypothetical protein
MKHELKYIKSKDIDKAKWDSLVSTSKDSNVFCFSWYLDTFCEWDIITLNDYKGGIALPKRKKLGLITLYQPNFIQKCVWFGTSLDSNHLEVLHTLIVQIFSLAHFNTNVHFGKVTERTNLIIHLNSDINTIRSQYSRSLKRNLKKNSGLIHIRENGKSSDAINLYKAIWGKLNPQLNDTDYKLLEDLVKKRPDNFVCMTVYKDQECIAGVLLVEGENRLHYILGANSASGKTENALSLLLDSIFYKYSSSDYIFDFEGSSIPSVKSFYETFGAVTEPFYELEINTGIVYSLKKIYNKLAKS